MFDLRFELLTSANHDPFFRCGNTWIEIWFQTQALRHDSVGRSKTYVLVGRITEPAPVSVLGFFSIRAEAQYLTGLESQEADVIGTSKYEPVPMIEIAYLARSSSVRGQGCGGILLVEALRVIFEVSQAVGVAGSYLNLNLELI